MALNFFDLISGSRHDALQQIIKGINQGGQDMGGESEGKCLICLNERCTTHLKVFQFVDSATAKGTCC